MPIKFINKETGTEIEKETWAQLSEYGKSQYLQVYEKRDNFLTSAVIGGITDSAVLGGLLGGSILGGFIGDELF